jgi:hypothetical protein
MKQFLLLTVLVTVLLSSCTTAFKAGQTPDDLYYSPGRSSEADDQQEAKKSRQDKDTYDLYVSSADDSYLRMKVANRSRWGGLDDYSYWYDSRYNFYGYNYNSPFNSFYSPFNNFYSPFSNFYSPYCSVFSPFYYSGYNPYYYGLRPIYGNIGWSNPAYTVISYSTPKFVPAGTTSTSNISAYRNKTYNNSNAPYVPSGGSSNGSSSNFGNLVKKVFEGNSNNNYTGNTYERAVRTYSSPASSASNNYSPPAPSSNAGGNSGGFKSTGTTTSTGRGGKN